MIVTKHARYVTHRNLFFISALISNYSTKHLNINDESQNVSVNFICSMYYLLCEQCLVGHERSIYIVTVIYQIKFVYLDDIVAAMLGDV